MTALSVTIYAGMALLSLDPCLIGLVTLPVSEGVAVWRLWCLCAGGGSGIGLVCAWSNVSSLWSGASWAIWRASIGCWRIRLALSYGNALALILGGGLAGFRWNGSGVGWIRRG
jgi:hypothetical protein